MEQIRVSDAISGWVTAGEDHKRGVVVIQEWWGITSITRCHASTIAERCRAKCLIPDIYHGKSTVDKEEGGDPLNVFVTGSRARSGVVSLTMKKLNY